jgi:hypothetical protein
VLSCLHPCEPQCLTPQRLIVLDQEPQTVEFCYRVGMDYVSCSPYRVPIARLAAAQAAISGGDKSEAARTS